MSYEIVVLDVGGANLAIPFQRAGQSEPERMGALQRAYAGNQYSSIFAEYMVVPLVSVPVDRATFAQVKSMFALGAQVPCQGGAAGNVFEGFAGVVVCSGKVTGDMEQSSDRWIINLVLTEVGTALSGVGVATYFLLTSVDSPDSADPTVFVSTPDGPPYPGDSSTDTLLLSGTTVPTGGSLNPSTPDLSFLSVPLNAGVISGALYVQMETSMSGVYSGTSVWAVMSVMAKIYQMRGATIIAGPFSTNYMGVGLGGGLGIMALSSSVVLTLLTGDQILVELYPRLQLQAAVADNGQRQSVSKGAVPGPRQNPLLGVGGIITSV